MAVQKVSIKARTRGKAAKDFVYIGIGKLTLRNVNDADGNPQVIDSAGEPVKYIQMGPKLPGKDRTRVLVPGLGVSLDDKKEYVLSEGYSYVTVHDVDVTGILPASPESFQEAMALAAEHATDKLSKEQIILDWAANGYNEYQRAKASPTVEAPPDELGQLVAEMITAGILTEDTSRAWRTSISHGSKGMEMKPLEFAELSPKVKALRAKAKTS